MKYVGGPSFLYTSVVILELEQFVLISRLAKKIFGPTSLNVRLAIPIVIHYIMYHNCFLTVRQTQPDIIQALPLL